MTVYLRVPPYLMTSQSKLLRIWLGTLISVLASRTVRPTVPDLLLIDEAAQVGKLDELLTAVSLLRGYGLRCWTFWQSLGQLEGLWGARHREFLDNASVLSVFGLANGASAAAAAALTGLDYEMLLDMTREQQALARFGERPMLCDRIDYRHDPDLMLLADTNPFHRPGFAAQEDIRHG